MSARFVPNRYRKNITNPMYIIKTEQQQRVPLKTGINSRESDTDVTSRLQNVDDMIHTPKNKKHVKYLLPTIFL